VIAAYNQHFHALDRAVPARSMFPQIFNAEIVQAQWPDFGMSSFYNEWARPNGIHEIASITVGGPHTTSLLLIGRPGDRRFDAAQLTILSLLQAHIGPMSRIAERMRRVERQANQFLYVLEQLPCGVVVIDRRARVAHATASAKATIRDGDGLSLTSRGLRANDLTADRRLQSAMVGGPSARACGEPIIVPRDRSALPLVVRVLQLPVTTGEPLLDENAALVFLYDPSNFAPRDARLLTALFRLTRAEAAVALRVGDGIGLSGVANELGVSVSTVRTHLQRIFAKTDTHRQAQLSQLLAGVYGQVAPTGALN
jgi:DNA-binding CsgD family transcriptional regulator